MCIAIEYSFVESLIQKIDFILLLRIVSWNTILVPNPQTTEDGSQTKSQWKEEMGKFQSLNLIIDSLWNRHNSRCKNN